MRVAPHAKAIRQAFVVREPNSGFADVAGFDTFRHSSFAMLITSKLLLPCRFLP
jgi:hypothetical protein